MYSTVSQLHLPYKTGKFYSLSPSQLASTVAVQAIDKIYFFPFYIYNPIFIKTWHLRIATGGAGSSAKSGIWNNSTLTDRPLGVAIAADNTGQATTANNTTTTSNITDFWLSPGWYWFGSKFTGTLPLMVGVTSNEPFYMNFMGGSNSLLSNMGISYDDTYSNDISATTIAEGGSFTETTGGGVPVAVVGT